MFRSRSTLLAVAGIAASLLFTACDSQSGIPGNSADGNSPSAAAPSTAPSTDPGSPSAESSKAEPTSSTPEGAPAYPVGAVPTNPQASTAVEPWAADLARGDISVLQRKCWTIAPMNIPAMYADKQGILAALAQPGQDGQFTVSWTGPQQTVSVKRSEISSGYACPYVHPTGTKFTYNDADARHTVRRYLARLTGRPIDPDDVESKYKLVCNNASIWDPQGTGTPIEPPLSANPNKLTGVTGFTDSELTSAPIREAYTSVTVPVTAGRTTAPRTFTLSIGANGYCIGDVSTG